MTTDAPITVDLVSPPIEVSEPVATHLKCVSCQYDLHNLPASGRCPECGWDIAATIAAFKLDYDWLITIRTGLRWLLASMYVLAYLAAMRYFRNLEFTVIALMQFGAALSLMTRNPNRPHEQSITRWTTPTLGAALVTYLISAANWVVDSDAGWIVLSIGSAMHAAGLAMLWRRISDITGQGIAPRSSTIARNIGVLTICVGVLTFLPALLWVIGLYGSSSYKLIEGIRLLWLLALVVWFFASVITLHLMGVTLHRLIESPKR